MSERAEGAIADTGEAIQRQINKVEETTDQVVAFIRERPIIAVLLAAGIGYLLGRIAC
ncbi:hypothetical protein [Rhodopila sp.]|jgi:ElaB/YqjD/DUF883 family membrane-anchored ribosome-binding protein|uniref:hypothetical protein n=1 Tax=Rhodopila sp. TaxID=2480087 RepID=UPI002D16C3E6|nr:hypothetical protein [Rhodopila sp.]HVZ09842.1 hypothetical protein [Rhodopila sp.]